MIKVQLTGAQETLLATLYGRALDARSEHPILGDTLADDTVRHIDYDFSQLHLTPGDAAGVALRAHQLDTWTQQFITDQPDAVVLHLGCGLDTRVHRLAPPPTVEWWDVDQADVIDLRTRLYPPRPGYHTVGASVTDAAWLAAVPSGRPTMVVAEGLLMYLTEQDGKHLITRLLDHFRAGGRLAFDAYSPLGIRLQGLNRAVRASGATLHWGISNAAELADLDPRLRVLDEVKAFDIPGRDQLPAPYRAATTALAHVPGVNRLAQLHLLAFTPHGPAPA
ncbi:class I SAM-dependent methyltransferase [Streptomyces sp. NPDC000987]|uniref:class I SAM-dependent methyltransferase n=1 Tax=Streptomyces sp. NPDC000987 TaxID=3154374 RepID=UPI0033230393